jgi:hypothetical protein
MFSIFAKKAAMADDNLDADGMPIPPQVVKIGGHEFMAGDTKSIQQFDNWAAKAQGDNIMIQTGSDGASYPIKSPQGQAELAKADLMLKHHASPESAQKAVDQVYPELKAKQPFVVYKSKAPSADTPGNTVVKAKPMGKEAMGVKSSAKANEGYRGPRGAVAT